MIQLDSRINQQGRGKLKLIYFASRALNSFETFHAHYLKVSLKLTAMLALYNKYFSFLYIFASSMTSCATQELKVQKI